MLVLVRVVLVLVRACVCVWCESWNGVDGCLAARDHTPPPCNVCKLHLFSPLLIHKANAKVLKGVNVSHVHSQSVAQVHLHFSSPLPQSRTRPPCSPCAPYTPCSACPLSAYRSACASFTLSLVPISPTPHALVPFPLISQR